MKSCFLVYKYNNKKAGSCLSLVVPTIQRRCWRSFFERNIRQSQLKLPLLIVLILCENKSIVTWALHLVGEPTSILIVRWHQEAVQALNNYHFIDNRKTQFFYWCFCILRKRKTNTFHTDSDSSIFNPLTVFSSVFDLFSIFYFSPPFVVFGDGLIINVKLKIRSSF